MAAAETIRTVAAAVTMLHLVAAAADEVDHNTLLTLMTAMFGIAITSPLVVMLVQTRRLSRDRREDRFERRQIATDLVASQKQSVDLTRKIAERTDKNLDIIHRLVNSNLTRVMEGERAAVEQALGAITEAINMKLAQGVEVLPESFAAQARLDEQLAALDRAIDERHATLRKLTNGTPNGCKDEAG